MKTIGSNLSLRTDGWLLTERYDYNLNGEKIKALNVMDEILIIDDSVPIRRLLEFMLTRENYKVISATDGFDALFYLSEGHRPKLIITDIEMPNFDGEKLLGNLNNSGFFSYIPVIVLTGLESEEMRQKCLEKGAFAYFKKPFDPAELLLSVKSALESAKV